MPYIVIALQGEIKNLDSNELIKQGEAIEPDPKIEFSNSNSSAHLIDEDLNFFELLDLEENKKSDFLECLFPKFLHQAFRGEQNNQINSGQSSINDAFSTEELDRIATALKVIYSQSLHNQLSYTEKVQEYLLCFYQRGIDSTSLQKWVQTQGWSA